MGFIMTDIQIVAIAGLAWLAVAAAFGTILYRRWAEIDAALRGLP